MKQIHLIIKGKVQGIFFREFTMKSARNLGLAGYVRNLPDGTVEVVAEGEEEDLKKLIAECRKGPLMAHVEDIEIEYKEPKKEFDNFYIRP